MKPGVWQLVIILVIVLIIFGPKKLPDLGAAMGKTIKDFRNSIKSDDKKKKGDKEAVLAEVSDGDAAVSASAEAVVEEAPAAETAPGPKIEE